MGEFHIIFWSGNFDHRKFRLIFNAFYFDFLTCLQFQMIWENLFPYTAEKMKFSIEDFFCSCNQIGSKLRIWSHLLKKSLMKNFFFCAVIYMQAFLILQKVLQPWNFHNICQSRTKQSEKNLYLVLFAVEMFVTLGSCSI